MKKIPVYRHSVIAAYALVDDDDFAHLSQHRWLLSEYGYAIAYRKQKPRNMRMHRAVMRVVDAGRAVVVDHIDRDKLNNQKANLRIVTTQENALNTMGKQGRKSRYRGVTPSKGGKWRVQERLDGKRVYLGVYADEDEAGFLAAQWRIENHPVCTDIDLDLVAQRKGPRAEA